MKLMTKETLILTFIRKMTKLLLNRKNEKCHEKVKLNAIIITFCNHYLRANSDTKVQPYN